MSTFTELIVTELSTNVHFRQTVSVQPAFTFEFAVIPKGVMTAMVSLPIGKAFA